MTPRQYTGTGTVDTRFMPAPSVVVTDTSSMLPVMSHEKSRVKGNCPTAKLAIVTLPNRRVSDAESKMVGGDVRPNGFVGWKRTSESVSGDVPAVMLRMKGTEKRDTDGQCSGIPSRPKADGTILWHCHVCVVARGVDTAHDDNCDRRRDAQLHTCLHAEAMIEAAKKCCSIDRCSCPSCSETASPVIA